MDSFELKRDAQGQLRLACPYRGSTLLRQAMYTRGTAFTLEERAAFRLEGLLPPHVSTLEEQSRRAYQFIMGEADALDRHIGLSALQYRNEVLFHRVLVDHLDELLPIIYTPTVGRACEQFSHTYARPRGLWITPDHRGRIFEVLGSAPFADVRLIVVTDNERILGLGDQGAGGMGIPVGKLAIYTAAAGIPPWQTLPVSLDVGTDSARLLDDDLYVGHRARRLRGPEYDSLVDEFVHAVRRRFPRALLQWEDFKKNNAFNLLDRYRRVLPSFNDDIQGTAAVAVAGVIAASRWTQVPLAGQRIVMLGAGAAGIGIARLLRSTLQRAGLTGEALTSAIACLDSRGLIVDDAPIADVPKREFAWPAALAARLGHGAGQPRDLLAVIRSLKPTVLVGTTGETGAFTEVVVREMAQHVERPLVLPMSNPTSCCEATPSDVLRWTGGRAIVATGSPFPPVELQGRPMIIGQANNAFVFPGVGLGVLVAEASEVTDGLFVAAADSLAGEIGPEHLVNGRLFPAIHELRRVTARIAEAVAREALHAGLARASLDAAAVPEAVAAAMWEPSYPPIDPA